MSVGGYWQQRRTRWIRNRHPRQAEARTGTRSIYIVPSRNGLAMLFFLAFVFVLAVNYQNALVFGLFFWLISLAILNLHYTHHNIAGLTIRCVASKNTFAGGAAEFELLLQRHGKRPRFAIDIAVEGAAQVQRVDLNDSMQQQITVSVAADKRGYITLPRLTLRSVYPLGIARTWSYANLTAYAVAYPAPLDGGVEASATGEVGAGDTGQSVPGVSDFESLRNYVPGDKMSRVHWAASTRTRALQVKQFVDPIARDEWLRWDDFAVLPAEVRLQHLAYKVCQLASGGQQFGLELPDGTIGLDKGDAHKVHCLLALGCYQKAKPDFG